MIVPIAPPFFSFASYVPASCQASLTMIGAQGFSVTSAVQSSQARRRFATSASRRGSGDASGEAAAKLAPRRPRTVHHRPILIIVLVVILALSLSLSLFVAVRVAVAEAKQHFERPPLPLLPFSLAARSDFLIRESYSLRADSQMLGAEGILIVIKHMPLVISARRRLSVSERPEGTGGCWFRLETSRDG